MLPLYPAKLFAVGADARVGVKVCAANQSAEAAIADGNADQCVFRFAILMMNFTDGNKPLARWIKNEVSKAWTLFSDSDGLFFLGE